MVISFVTGAGAPSGTDGIAGGIAGGAVGDATGGAGSGGFVMSSRYARYESSSDRSPEPSGGTAGTSGIIDGVGSGNGNTASTPVGGISGGDIEGGAASIALGGIGGAGDEGSVLSTGEIFVVSAIGIGDPISGPSGATDACIGNSRPVKT
ncbi:MAG: hypothetical protein QGH39_07530, partial [Candidatus Thermoplasmatota archaeon]|nr:hypothetical protein [Candidatus Thermoplasmatota archaeon]